jgi:hypothetical protein
MVGAFSTAFSQFGTQGLSFPLSSRSPPSWSSGLTARSAVVLPLVADAHTYVPTLLIRFI